MRFAAESLRGAAVGCIRLERNRPGSVFLEPPNGIDGLLADGVIDTVAETYSKSSYLPEALPSRPRARGATRSAPA